MQTDALIICWQWLYPWQVGFPTYYWFFWLSGSDLQWVAWSLTLKMGSEVSRHGQSNFYFLANPSCFFNSIFYCLDDNFHCWQLRMIKYTIFKHKEPPCLEVQNNTAQGSELFVGTGDTCRTQPASAVNLGRYWLASVKAPKPQRSRRNLCCQL